MPRNKGSKKKGGKRQRKSKLQTSDRNVFSEDGKNDEMRDDDAGDAKQTHVAVKVHVPQTYESGEQIFRRNQARKKLVAVLVMQVS